MWCINVLHFSGKKPRWRIKEIFTSPTNTLPVHIQASSLPFHEQLLQLIHGAAQLVRECGDFVERQIELPQRRAGDSGVKGQQGTHTVTRDVQHAQREQRQQLHWQRLELVALQVQTSQTLQTLCQIKNKQKNKKASALDFLLSFDTNGDSAQIRWLTWQRAEGNSSRLLWLRSRRKRCVSCCWTKLSSIRQDRESSSLPDRSSRRILSLSLGRAAEFSPDPNTEDVNRRSLGRIGWKDCPAGNMKSFYIVRTNNAEMVPYWYITNWTKQYNRNQEGTLEIDNCHILY